MKKKYDLNPSVEQPWMKNYPKNAKREEEYDVVPLDGVLKKQAKEIPDAVCMKFMKNSWTYAQVDKMVDEFAAGLLKLGLKKGEGVLIDLPNSPQFVIAYYGAMRAGGVANPVIPLHKMAEIVYQANDSNSTIGVFMDKIFQGYLFGKGLEEKIPSMKAVILTGLGDMMPGFTRFMGKMLGKIPYWKKWEKKDGNVPLIPFDDVYEKVKPQMLELLTSLTKICNQTVSSLIKNFDAWRYAQSIIKYEDCSEFRESLDDLSNWLNTFMLDIERLFSN